MSFVHLHLHTEYSLENSTIRVKPLIEQAAAAGMSAVALTDLGNLFAAVKFYRAATAAQIKPIFGAELRIRSEEEKQEPTRIVALAQNQTGFKNLKELLSQAYIEGQVLGVPMIQQDWLTGKTDGLIALFGKQSVIGQAALSNKSSAATAQLEAAQTLFPAGNFYLALQRTGRAGDEIWNHAAVDLAQKFQLPVVATNEVLFLQEEDFSAHEARVCIHSGYVLEDARRPREFSDQQYLRTPEEMAELFSDIPEAIENTIEIARRCTVELELGKSYLPDFPIPAGLTIEEFFNQESEKGLEWRLEQLFETPEAIAANRPPYDERLQIELDVINGMGFPGYFLIVADFIQWAKNQQIPVGPGRGSGAGSLVAYALKITDLDPLKYELLFERFLNPERVSMPDFDVDFCMDRRDEVIRYVADTYGKDKVSQIITFGSMNAKAVVRDVGRVLGHPYGMVDRIAKLIPFDLKMTLKKALDESEELFNRYNNEEEVKELIDLAMSLEGLTRNAGKHAGGVVISPSALTDFTPIYCEENGAGLVSQFDKDDVEAVGLVKFDFLGLRTLTIIDWAVDMINTRREKSGEEKLQIEKINLEDEPVFKLLQSGHTTAVFQLESQGMQELICKLRPDNFEDIIALVALYRPGPLESGMVDNFIARKHGEEEISYPDPNYQHESLKTILDPTYGVILYQEQVMQIAQVLAGYSLGGADLLRRAMGKKKPEEMAKQRSVFEQGAIDNNVDGELAMKIFDLVEKFAGYGFNKSHSAAYALVSYQTAWLKHYFPAEFMAAVLSSDMDNTEKVVHMVHECKSDWMDLTVRAPRINISLYKFSVNEAQEVVYGLGAIKGVGEAAIEGIVAEREANGNYVDLFDFCRRIDLRKANKRVLEALICSGAMDEMAPELPESLLEQFSDQFSNQPSDEKEHETEKNDLKKPEKWLSRATLMNSLADAMQDAERRVNNQNFQQNDMFSGDVETIADQKPDYQWVAPWSEDERLGGEMDTIGLYLTGHPIQQYEEELENFVLRQLSKLVPNRDKATVIAGLVTDLRVVKTRAGKPLAIVKLEDRSGSIETTLFAETFEPNRHLLQKNTVLVMKGVVAQDDYTGGLRMTVEEVWDLAAARARFCKFLQLDFPQTETPQQAEKLLSQLEKTLEPYRWGETPVKIAYRQSKVEAMLELSASWRVNLDSELVEKLNALLGIGAVLFQY